MPLTHSRRDLFRRFTDDLERSDHRIKRLLVLRELCPGHVRDELGDKSCSVLDVGEAIEKFASARHKPTTSLRIRRPISGLSVPFMTRSTLTPKRLDK